MTGKLDHSDRLKIMESDSFQDILLEFINSPSPLSACVNCVGTVGILEDQESIPRSQWREYIEKFSEDLIDFDYLDKCMLIQDEMDDCKINILTSDGRSWGVGWMREHLPIFHRARIR